METENFIKSLIPKYAFNNKPLISNLRPLVIHKLFPASIKDKDSDVQLSLLQASENSLSYNHPISCFQVIFVIANDMKSIAVFPHTLDHQQYYFQYLQALVSYHIHSQCHLSLNELNQEFYGIVRSVRAFFYFSFCFTFFLLALKKQALLFLYKHKHILSIFYSLRFFLIASISFQINCKEQYHTNKF